MNAASRTIVASLMSDGRVRRAYLGITGGSRPLPPRAAEMTGQERGLEVVSVVAGSPAALAGMRPEDIVVAIDGTPVEDVGDLQRLMTAGRIGAGVTLSVVRAGTLQDLDVVPEELR